MIDRDWRIVYANRWPISDSRSAIRLVGGCERAGAWPCKSRRGRRGSGHAGNSVGPTGSRSSFRPSGDIELTTSQVQDGVALILRTASSAAGAAGAARPTEPRCSVSTFLAAINHEVRTPLNGILGYTDLLLEDRNLNSLQREHVARIRGAGSALLSVANEIELRDPRRH